MKIVINFIHGGGVEFRNSQLYAFAPGVFGYSLLARLLVLVVLIYHGPRFLGLLLFSCLSLQLGAVALCGSSTMVLYEFSFTSVNFLFRLRPSSLLRQ